MKSFNLFRILKMYFKIWYNELHYEAIFEIWYILHWYIDVYVDVCWTSPWLPMKGIIMYTFLSRRSTFFCGFHLVFVFCAVFVFSEQMSIQRRIIYFTLSNISDMYEVSHEPKNVYSLYLDLKVFTKYFPIRKYWKTWHIMF